MKTQERNRHLKEFYRIDEVAAILDVCERTVRRMIEDEEIKAIRIRGTLRISQKEIARVTRYRRSSRR